MKLLWFFNGGRFVLYDFVSDQLSTLVERSYRETSNRNLKYNQDVRIKVFFCWRFKLKHDTFLTKLCDLVAADVLLSPAGYIDICCVSVQAQPGNAPKARPSHLTTADKVNKVSLKDSPSKTAKVGSFEGCGPWIETQQLWGDMLTTHLNLTSS